jgi:hypothetical protein
MLRARGPTGKRKGVALVLAIFFMILLALIGITLIGMVPVELKTATRTKLDLQAHYAATAGIRRARIWCQAVMTPETLVTSPDRLGDDNTIWNNTYCNYLNEIASVPNSNTDFRAMPLSGLLGGDWSAPNISSWGGSPFRALNSPATGNGAVDPDTIVVASRTPLVIGDWAIHTVIIPDADSPGGANTLDGAGRVVRQFGGAGATGQRCYQIVTLVFNQGLPVVRAKSVFLESSFARYSLFVNQDPENTWYLTGTRNQQSTEGPVHTNNFFRFALNPALWGSTASDKKPFNSQMTFANRAGSNAYAGLDYDGALYYKGNDSNAQDQDFRPFGGGSEDVRYSQMFANGRGDLRQTSAPISLPQDNSKIAKAAYGEVNGASYSKSIYTDTAIAGHLDNRGIYVMGQSGNAGRVAGGVLVKGNQQRMFLEAIGTNGLPFGVNAAESSSLASGSAPNVNPAIRVQSDTAITRQLFSTSAPFQTSVSTSRHRSSITQTTISTSAYASQSSTGMSYRSSTQTLGTFSTYTTSGGGAYGVVQTTSSFVSTGTSILTTWSSTLFTSFSTPSISTSTSWSPWTTQFSTFNTVTSSLTGTASWKPVDQVIETKNAGITLSPAAFSSNHTRFQSPAGARGGGANMESLYISNTVGGATAGHLRYTQFIVKDGNNAPSTLTGAASQVIPVDKVVVIKQSRTDPQTAVVMLMDRGNGNRSEGDPVLNGAVFTEGNVGGLAGINLERKTIAGQVKQEGTSNSADPLDPQPNRDSVTLSIRNNIWQYGTNPSLANENDLTAAKPGGADHGLGLVAEVINVNTRPGDFATYSDGALTSSSQVLSIYATMLAGGRKDSFGNMLGGFTVGVNNPLTSLNSITSSAMGGSNNTPMLRTVGGLIVANYYARLNLINQAGWNSQAVYDQQLALKPPPWFPNDGGLNPLTYVEERLWGQR